MTDNEIIKALECCITDEPCRKTKCPFYKNNTCGNDIRALERLALDLINRLQAENERLKEDNKNYIKVAETQQSLSMERFFEINRLTERLEKRTTELDRLTIYFDKAVEEKLKTAKAEAYKEFFQLLHKKLTNTSNSFFECKNLKACEVLQDAIDKLRETYKEMVGEDNA